MDLGSSILPHLIMAEKFIEGKYYIAIVEKDNSVTQQKHGIIGYMHDMFDKKEHLCTSTDGKEETSFTGFEGERPYLAWSPKDFIEV